MRIPVRYLLSRLLHAAFVIFGVFTLVFVLVHVSGDPLVMLLPMDASPADRDRLAVAYGLDQPLPVQYVTYLGRAVRGDLGMSLRFREPAFQLVLDRLPATLQLGGLALLIALAIAGPAALVGALRPNGRLDAVFSLLALVGQAIPTFWLGLLLIMVVAVQWRLLPTSGRGGPEHLVLPAIALSAYSAALLARVLRSSLLDIVGRDYIRTARAKGLRETVVIRRHALKNALIPAVTIVGLQLGNLFGGAVITETVFAYPGMGLLAVQAISNQDFPVVQAFVVVVSSVVVLASLATDVVYTLLDPRIRYE
jgi:peptide/nickel transport system permease protein